MGGSSFVSITLINPDVVMNDGNRSCAQTVHRDPAHWFQSVAVDLLGSGMTPGLNMGIAWRHDIQNRHSIGSDM